VTATALVIPTPSPRRSSGQRAVLIATRLAGLVVLIAVPSAVTALADAHTRLAHDVRDLTDYSPDRLIHGHAWTVITSGVVGPRLRDVHEMTIVLVAVLVPFALLCGAWQTVKVFLSGHILSTLAIAVVVLPGAALGWHTAYTAVHTIDNGVSAGLAAVGGALAVVAWRWSRALGGFLLVALAAFLAGMLIFKPFSFGRELSGIEHFIAVVVGAFVEWRYP
jgi:hypothetical protein